MEADGPKSRSAKELTEAAGEVGGVEGVASGGGEDEAGLRPSRSGGPPFFQLLLLVNRSGIEMVSRRVV